MHQLSIARLHGSVLFKFNWGKSVKVDPSLPKYDLDLAVMLLKFAGNDCDEIIKSTVILQKKICVLDL